MNIWKNICFVCLMSTLSLCSCISVPNGMATNESTLTNSIEYQKEDLSNTITIVYGDIAKRIKIFEQKCANGDSYYISIERIKNDLDYYYRIQLSYYTKNYKYFDHEVSIIGDGKPIIKEIVQPIINKDVDNIWMFVYIIDLENNEMQELLRCDELRFKFVDAEKIISPTNREAIENYIES